MGMTIDSLLSLLGGTVFHPAASLLLPGAIIITQACLVHLGVPDPLSWALKVALGCVAVSWVLQLNRVMNRKALNPAPKVSCHWPDEIVVVTGGSGGIGGELVRRLERLGARVAIMDAVPPAFATGNGTCYFQTDVASFDNVTSVYNNIVAKLGVPTILVANAGILRGKTLLDSCEDDLRSTFDVNVLGVLFCIKAFLPAMIAANRGHVLVTSSVAAYSTAASVVGYSASKAAVNSVVEGLHTELKHKYGNPSVKVSTVMPAAVKTKMSEDLEPPVNGFIMPLLEPACVAERMLQVLSGGQSETVLMPAMSNTSPCLHALPCWVRVGAQDTGARATARLSTEKKVGLA